VLDLELDGLNQEKKVLKKWINFLLHIYQRNQNLILIILEKLQKKFYHLKIYLYEEVILFFILVNYIYIENKEYE
jgi:hypothetical protein